MKEDLKKYLIKKFGNEFKIESCEKNGKNYDVVLDFGNGEKLGVSIRERKGDNGNFRITGEWDAED